eukprot:GHVS01048857.1.p2 GENE.GHVS01048857.1~~GHVS01048857.1.p2  ORF type:complete len:144 (-),score=32.33 GHVS01048857.1:459-890(-)
MGGTESSQRHPAAESVEEEKGIAVKTATMTGAAIGCLAPVAVTSVLNGMGFTASGIVAGSTAAGMMSASALASGGGVAAGGMVAILQSIGAVGLAVGPALVVAAIGAILGATVLIVAALIGMTIFGWFSPTAEEEETTKIVQE